ncbi:hypothetical protein D3C78_1416200 [compost metagenome]
MRPDEAIEDQQRPHPGRYLQRVHGSQHAEEPHPKANSPWQIDSPRERQPLPRPDFHVYCPMTSHDQGKDLSRSALSGPWRQIRGTKKQNPPISRGIRGFDVMAERWGSERFREPCSSEHSFHYRLVTKYSRHLCPTVLHHVFDFRQRERPAPGSPHPGYGG